MPPVRDWIGAVGAKTAYIERGSPWENGFIESFNARLRDELLDGEIFYSLAEARIVIESWRRQATTTERPHGSFGLQTAVRPVSHPPPSPRRACFRNPGQRRAARASAEKPTMN